MTYLDDINDDEIRIISARPKGKHKSHRKRWWIWGLAGCVLVVVAVLLAHFFSNRPFLPERMEKSETTTESGGTAVLSTISECAPAGVHVNDTVVNDVPLRILTPVNALPELFVGQPDTMDKSIILCLQASDIRADNQEIVGAFVLKGELLSRGIAKKGFCAIFDREVQIGMAESTPLFEEAINQDGYFFRQYPLVCNGHIVENKPKNKSLRHALCELDGHIVIASCLDKESFHDFAQAVADLGVANAIALTGAQAYGFCRDMDGGFQSWGETQKWKQWNFIVWRAPR